MRPESGRSRPARQRRRVVLPAPEGPKMAVMRGELEPAEAGTPNGRSRSGILSSAPEEKRFWMWRRRIIGARPSSAAAARGDREWAAGQQSGRGGVVRVVAEDGRGLGMEEQRKSRTRTRTRTRRTRRTRTKSGPWVYCTRVRGLAGQSVARLR